MIDVAAMIKTSVPTSTVSAGLWSVERHPGARRTRIVGVGQWLTRSRWPRREDAGNGAGAFSTAHMGSKDMAGRGDVAENEELPIGSISTATEGSRNVTLRSGAEILGSPFPQWSARGRQPADPRAG